MEGGSLKFSSRCGSIGEHVHKEISLYNAIYLANQIIDSDTVLILT